MYRQAQEVEEERLALTIEALARMENKHDAEFFAAELGVIQYYRTHPKLNEDTNMKVSEMTGGTYLRKDDIGDDMLLTIKNIKREKVGTDEDAEEKFVMYFKELEKGLVLNKTNIQMAAKSTGEDDSDNWAGKKIVLYFDEAVSYAGKVVGGLRLRAARKPAKTPPGYTEVKHPPTTSLDDLDDDIPF